MTNIGASSGNNTPKLPSSALAQSDVQGQGVVKKKNKKKKKVSAIAGTLPQTSTVEQSEALSSVQATSSVTKTQSNLPIGNAKQVLTPLIRFETATAFLALVSKMVDPLTARGLPQRDPILDSFLDREQQSKYRKISEDTKDGVTFGTISDNRLFQNSLASLFYFSSYGKIVNEILAEYKKVNQSSRTVTQGFQGTIVDQNLAMAVKFAIFLKTGDMASIPDAETVFAVPSFNFLKGIVEKTNQAEALPKELVEFTMQCHDLGQKIGEVLSAKEEYESVMKVTSEGGALQTSQVIKLQGAENKIKRGLQGVTASIEKIDGTLLDNKEVRPYIRQSLSEEAIQFTRDFLIYLKNAIGETDHSFFNQEGEDKKALELRRKFKEQKKKRRNIHDPLIQLGREEKFHATIRPLLIQLKLNGVLAEVLNVYNKQLETANPPLRLKLYPTALGQEVGVACHKTHIRVTEGGYDKNSETKNGDTVEEVIQLAKDSVFGLMHEFHAFEEFSQRSFMVTQKEYDEEKKTLEAEVQTFINDLSKSHTKSASNKSLMQERRDKLEAHKQRMSAQHQKRMDRQAEEDKEIKRREAARLQEVLGASEPIEKDQFSQVTQKQISDIIAISSEPYNQEIQHYKAAYDANRAIPLFGSPEILIDPSNKADFKKTLEHIKTEHPEFYKRITAEIVPEDAFAVRQYEDSDMQKFVYLLSKLEPTEDARLRPYFHEDFKPKVDDMDKTQSQQPKAPEADSKPQLVIKAPSVIIFGKMNFQDGTSEIVKMACAIPAYANQKSDIARLSLRSAYDVDLNRYRVN